MTAVEQRVIQVNSDGTEVIEAFIIANETPSSFPKTGETINKMNARQFLAPFSIIYVPSTKKVYVADEDVNFWEQ